MWYEEKEAFFLQETRFIKENYPELHYKIRDGIMTLSGIFHFTASYKGEEISDCYKIRIAFPENYPDELPIIGEIGGRIPNSYHHLDDGALCLGTPADLYTRFAQARNIKNYLNNIVIHYLYRYSYIEKNNKEPYGDRAHGFDGIIEGYQELLKTDNARIVFLILHMEYDKRTKQDYKFNNFKCLCGSGKKFKLCHGKYRKKLRSLPISYLMIHLYYLHQYTKRYLPLEFQEILNIIETINLVEYYRQIHHNIKLEEFNKIDLLNSKY